MKTLALYNIKGGVGKTAAAVNLAYAASQEPAPTLLCDLDPQASASYYFRIRPEEKFTSRKLVRGGKKLAQHIKGTDYENLDLLPSTLSYRNLDLVLDGLKRSKKRLLKILHPFEKQYEYIFLDCPPSITLVSENIFRAADRLLVPLIPTTLSLRTYEQLLAFFEDKGLDPSRILAFFSMVEKRKKLHRDTIQASAAWETHTLRTQIPYASDVEKMGLHREPVACFCPKSPAAAAYGRLWSEIKPLV